jgi:hypothetical protein
LSLLYHTATGGFEELAIDHSEAVKPPEEDPTVGDGNNGFLWELAPGGEVRLTADLPARYYRALQAGKKYTLLYPGGEVVVWEWCSCSNEQHRGRVSESLHIAQDSDDEDGRERLPRLVVPGGARISFIAQTEETPWPERPAYEAERGLDMANRAEQQWREEEARKGMRIIEGSPAPHGPDERVQVFPFITVMEAAAGRCNLKTTLTCETNTVRGSPFSVLPSTARQLSLAAGILP